NTPEALAVLFEMVKEANRQLDKKDDLSMGSLAAMEKQFRDLAGGVLGILPVTLEVTTPRDTVLEGLMQILLDLRQEYRAAGEGKQADMLRDRLTLLGITLTDGPEGSSWRLEE
ncbi:MAG TPA: cysteine--tRNA ligase, partial [Anaerolineae bacterium]|nr:cysteine--tRNA ligase [Anaerolineae bacterium]